jgi:putative MFS transporter
MAVISHAYQTEVFPTRIRSRAAGFVYSFSRIGAALSGFLIAFLLELGVVGVFAGTACYLVVTVAIGVFGPKTTGRRLDEIAR